MSQDRVRLLEHIAHDQFGSACGVSLVCSLSPDRRSFHFSSHRLFFFFCSIVRCFGQSLLHAGKELQRLQNIYISVCNR